MFSVENNLKIFKEFLRINYLQYYLNLLISENINILEIFEHRKDFVSDYYIRMYFRQKGTEIYMY